MHCYIFFLSACVHALFSLTNCAVQSLRGGSIFICTSQDSDKVRLHPNRSESKPKCHLSCSRGFSPIQLPRSYLGLDANKEYLVFKMGKAQLRLWVPLWEHSRLQIWGLEYITPSAINCCLLYLAVQLWV